MLEKISQAKIARRSRHSYKILNMKVYLCNLNAISKLKERNKGRRTRWALFKPADS